MSGKLKVSYIQSIWEAGQECPKSLAHYFHTAVIESHQGHHVMGDKIKRRLILRNMIHHMTGFVIICVRDLMSVTRLCTVSCLL